VKWRWLIFFAPFLPLLADAQATPNRVVARDDSGQFIVAGAPQPSRLANLPSVANNTNFVRLEPAILAISAGRIKASLWRKLDISGGWHGKIFLTIHSAQSLDEDVTIVSEKFPNGWDYRVALPDVLSRVRFLRAMTGVVLLEFANRGAARSAEIPAWLIDGLSQQLLISNDPEMILSSPYRLVNGLAESHTMFTQRGLDPLSNARRILQNNSPLTFEQLSWPTDMQIAGDDGGVYRASAQLFVSDLLNLENGAAKLRAMLNWLPRYYNWQTAFQIAFRENFSEPLDVEKWWTLQTVSFVMHGRSPVWTPAVSREKLGEILSVAVDLRASSNALPALAEISLQAAIRDLDYAQQAPIFQTKLRDLELAQFQMPGPFALLADEYRRVLADYLNQRSGVAWRGTVSNKRPQVVSAERLVRDTIQKLDALDARKQAVETLANSNEVVQPNLAQKKF
jgi:hypothetical protein